MSSKISNSLYAISDKPSRIHSAPPQSQKRHPKYNEHHPIEIPFYFRKRIHKSSKISSQIPNVLGAQLSGAQLSAPECDIRIDFDTNDCPNIFVSRKRYERISEYICIKRNDKNVIRTNICIEIYTNLLIYKYLSHSGQHPP